MAKKRKLAVAKSRGISPHQLITGYPGAGKSIFRPIPLNNAYKGKLDPLKMNSKFK